MEPTHPRDGFRDESPRNQFTTDRQGKHVPNDHNRVEDERERSNDGDWDSMRKETRADDARDYSHTNDNSGGAGSTGSEATNSGYSDI